jgi:hypothetical protein
MPSPSEFKKAFKLNKGATLPSRTKNKNLAEVLNASIGHTVKIRNERYEFPSTVDLKIADSATTKSNLEAAIKEYLKNELTAYSAYGSPYSCSVANVEITSFEPEKDHARISFLGKAVRRRDILTLKQQTEAKREKEEEAAAGPSKKKKQKMSVPTKNIQVSKEDINKWISHCRVIRSRWGSRKCAVCGEKIEHGNKIAKDASSTEKGGWMHVSCAVEQAKEENESNGVANASCVVQ